VAHEKEGKLPYPEVDFQEVEEDVEDMVEASLKPQ